MQKWSIWSWGVIAALGPASALAQPVCLDFSTALARAQTESPNVDAARADLAEAEAALTEAKSLFRPQLSTFGRAGLGDNGLVDSQIENLVGLRASQRVFDFGNAKFARRAARADIASRESAMLDAQTQSALRVGEAYIGWLETGARLGATSERISYFTEQLTAINAVYDSGGATLTERAEVGAALAEAQAEALELGLARDRFAAVVQINANAANPLCPAGESAADDLLGQTAAELAPDSGARMDRAVEDNARVRSLASTVASLEAQSAQARRARLPVVEVVGIVSFANDGAGIETGIQERVGVDISVPLYTGNAIGARSRQAGARRDRAEADLQQAKREVREQITLSQQRVLSLTAQVERRAAVEALSLQLFEAAQIERERGVRTLQLLIDVRLQYEAAILTRIAVAYELRREQLRLLGLFNALAMEEEAIR